MQSTTTGTRRRPGVNAGEHGSLAVPAGVLAALFLLLAPAWSHGQEMSDAQRSERCENNRRSLDDKERQLGEVKKQLAGADDEGIARARAQLGFIRRYVRTSVEGGVSAQEREEIERTFRRIRNDYVGPRSAACGEFGGTIECTDLIQMKIEQHIERLVQLRRELVPQRAKLEDQVAFHRNRMVELGCEAAREAVPPATPPGTPTTDDAPLGDPGAHAPVAGAPAEGAPVAGVPGALQLVAPPQVRATVNAPFGADGSGGNDQVVYGASSARWTVLRTPGSGYPDVSAAVEWVFGGIPHAISPGETFRVTASGTCSIAPDPSWQGGMSVGPGLSVSGLEVLSHRSLSVCNSGSGFVPSGAAEWELRLPPGATSASIAIGAGMAIGDIAEYRYQAKP
ncbi:MAG TPA: hypothetical protein VIC56_02035 [Gemmatimonadota bacterium]